MTQTDSLQDLADAGYVIDEWARWQQGGCDTYAAALMQLRSDLRLGVLSDPDFGIVHFFAHDDHFAYDSAGRHVLPYRGITGTLTADLDQDPGWYDEPDGTADDLTDAIDHIVRHRKDQS